MVSRFFGLLRIERPGFSNSVVFLGRMSHSFSLFSLSYCDYGDVYFLPVRLLVGDFGFGDGIGGIPKIRDDLGDWEIYYRYLTTVRYVGGLGNGKGDGEGGVLLTPYIITDDT